MKATFAIAAAAALVGGASANVHNRHVHDSFHGKVEKKGYAVDKNSTTECGCTTIYSTWYGEATRKWTDCSIGISNAVV